MSTTLYIQENIGGVNARNGRFMKGHVPANKGKTWDEFMPKKSQRRSAKGWKNLDIHRNKNGRPDNAGRCRKQVVGIMDDGKWRVFSYIGSAGRWVGGSRENVGRCCRLNEAKAVNRKTGGINTDHRYKGVRFYFETDTQWINKIDPKM